MVLMPQETHTKTSNMWHFKIAQGRQQLLQIPCHGAWPTLVNIHVEHPEESYTLGPAKTPVTSLPRIVEINNGI